MGIRKTAERGARGFPHARVLLLKLGVIHEVLASMGCGRMRESHGTHSDRAAQLNSFKHSRSRSITHCSMFSWVQSPS